MIQRLLIILFLVIKTVMSFSDVGIWDISMNGEGCKITLAKSLFKNSEVSVRLYCESEMTRNISVLYEWEAIKCSPDYYHYFEKTSAECSSQANREVRSISNETFLRIEKQETCDHRKTILFENKPGNRTNRKKNPLILVDHDGIYVFQMYVYGLQNYNVSVHIEMISPSGYLSAAIWPLLPFFGVMCGVYALLCTGWLIVCWLQWRDLLRIQYWIGGVALLGMIESATYYAVYANINSTGLFNPHAYIFAEWVSVAKRALARMLVIIVSLGFGIVKPRLGPALQRVVATGLLWGLLASIEAWLHLHHKQNDSNRDLLLSQAPLSLLDSAICWWVFVSLAQTMRTLQLRRNTIKLALYRHFTNTLIFAVISSVVFMLYSIKNYRITACIMEWRSVWMDSAYWHMLFASVLAVIMLLWRPTNNNQRYAFTPLLDNADDEDDEEEQFVNDAYGVKMRTGIESSTANNDVANGAPASSNSSAIDSDLRWVEENIPTSTIPLLDSDEEIINTKFEVSKMQ